MSANDSGEFFKIKAERDLALQRFKHIMCAAHNHPLVELRPMADSFYLVISTCPTAQVAESIARHLVENDLAACVNVIPGARSVYKWKGQIETGDEHLLLIKSRSSGYGQVQDAIISQHPYELPEVIAVPITAGFPAYLAWLDANVRHTS